MPYRKSSGIYFSIADLINFIFLLEDNEEEIRKRIHLHKEEFKDGLMQIVEMIYEDLEHISPVFIDPIIYLPSYLGDFLEKLEKVIRFSKKMNVPKEAWLEAIEDMKDEKL